MAKINISIDDELLARADKFADGNYMSRSGMITQAVNQFLNQHEALMAMKEMALLLRKIDEKGMVDPETADQLSDLERVFKLMSGQ